MTPSSDPSPTEPASVGAASALRIEVPEWAWLHRDGVFGTVDEKTNWVTDLVSAGIQVTQDVLRDRAVSVLQSYASGGGAIYNGGS